jgi:hypothetical protein
MDAHLLEPLRAGRAAVRREWEVLLRTEPVVTPLGNPDTLTRMIDRTLDEVFAILGATAAAPSPGRHEGYAAIRANCGCGRNPLLAYFLAGERAMLERLVLVQAEVRDLPPEKRDRAVTELYLALHRIARREITAFCSFCRHRAPEHASAAAPAVRH